MKLSDIGDLQKMAAEFRALEAMLQHIRDIDQRHIKIIFTGAHPVTGKDVTTELAWNEQQTVNMEDFEQALYVALESVQKVIRTKLAMCGVDDFNA